jgi:hypothetical protein
VKVGKTRHKRAEDKGLASRCRQFSLHRSQRDFARSKMLQNPLHNFEVLRVRLNGAKPRLIEIAKWSFARINAMSPVTSKPASRGRIKTGHSEVIYSYRVF